MGAVTNLLLHLWFEVCLSQCNFLLFESVRRSSFELRRSFLLPSQFMSKPMQPLSEDERVLLQQLMQRAQATVNASSLETPGPMTHGAMSDACKRHLSDDEDELYSEEFERVSMVGSFPAEHALPGCSQKPVPPLEMKGIKFPPGVVSLEDWGSTVCKLPKVSNLQVSYAEMVADQSTHGDYLLWVWKHGEKKGGRLEDLFLYLKAINYGSKHVHAETEVFPGTNLVRERKQK